MSSSREADRPPNSGLHPSAHLDTFARDGLPPQEMWPTLNLQGTFKYPATLNVTAALLDDVVRDGFGARVAIRSRTLTGTWSEITYRALQRQVDAIAYVLVRELGMVTGNRVLLRGYNGIMLAAAWLAVLKAGGVAVTTMPLLRAGELQTVMRHSGCTIALCDERLKHELAAACGNLSFAVACCCWGDHDNELAANQVTAVADETLERRMARYIEPFDAVQTASDDVCLIAYTSGSTGVPKGCLHFHRDVMAMCDSFAAHVLRLSPDDCCIGTPPLAFTFGLGALLIFPMHARATAVLLEGATPESMLEAIAETHATMTATAPTFYRLMALAVQREPHRFDTSSLRISLSAGEALPDATRDAWRAVTGVEMLDGIGSTEMIHVFIASRDADVRKGAIGRAVPGYEAAILDDQLNPVPTGQTGRLAVRGPTGCRYLHGERQASYVQGGWNLTGDACSMDADGYVYFQARTDDLIISSGYNIGAPEVESAVMRHEAVSECAVVGVPDIDRGQCVKAFVVLRPGFSASVELVRDIQNHVKGTIAPYKYPRSVEFCDALPRTETGKLQRFRLKAT